MTHKDKIHKLGLGTAQLSLVYSMQMTRELTEDEAFCVLKYALDNGINLIDTAPIYGSSERRIGKAMQETDAEVCVVTKLEAQEFPEEIWTDKDALSRRVREEFEGSCANLRLERISGYMLHFVAQALRNDGMVLDELVRMKGAGCIEFTGTSLYTSEELERCLDDKRIDAIQAPFSILDRRLAESGLLSRASKKGLTVFTRSTYLQGLLLINLDELPVHLKKAKQVLHNVHVLAKGCGMSVAELCLRYAFSVNEISSVVVGVASLQQLKEAVRIAALGPLEKGILREVESLPQMPADLIDVRSWSQNYDFKRN